ncbi:hypothetical protein WJX82_011691 [Trebouxia sp. C0006]
MALFHLAVSLSLGQIHRPTSRGERRSTLVHAYTWRRHLYQDRACIHYAYAKQASDSLTAKSRHCHPRVTHKCLSTSPITAASVSGTRTAKAPVQTFPASKCNFWSPQGYQVQTAVEKRKDTYVAQIDVSVSSKSDDKEVYVSWGAYRASAAKWFHPDSISADESEPDPHCLQAGHPLPQGPAAAAVSEDGTTCDLNFSVRSRHAASMSLCLARRTSDPEAKIGFLEVALDPLVNKTGDMWHVCLEGLKDVGSLCYGWRAEADVAWEGRSRFHPGQVMMDPYCPLVAHTRLPDNANLVAPKGGAAGSMPINTPEVPLSSLAFLLDDFSFQGVDRPGHSLHDTVMLELDVASFTSGRQAEEDGVPPQHQGKYVGLLDRLELIRQVGATAVLLTPVVMTAEGNGPMGQAPMSFFAPNPALAVGSHPAAASQELKHVIKELHAHGIEVILQVEYCFTSEGSDKQPQASSLRGLDAATYYRYNGVLNCGHAVVRHLIMDSLHHWAEEYQVDGFCFVNAETLVQDADGNILDNPPLADDIAQDPLLQSLKLIAWVADDTLLPRLGERGFPHWGIWAERNKAFQRDITSWLAHNQSGLASAVATRMTGSADLMASRCAEGLLPSSLATGRPPAWGLNSVSAVGSHSLASLITQVHWDQGEEGQRGTLAKSLLTSSLLCQGTAIILQDAIQEPSLARFMATVVHFRKTYASLLQPAHFTSSRELRWHGATTGSEPDWLGEAAASGYHAANFIGYSLHRPGERSIYIAYNPYKYPMQIDIPDAPSGHIWRRVVDTAEAVPLDAMTRLHEFPSLLQHNQHHIQAKAAIALISEAVS